MAAGLPRRSFGARQPLFCEHASGDDYWTDAASILRRPSGSDSAGFLSPDLARTDTWFLFREEQDGSGLAISGWPRQARCGDGIAADKNERFVAAVAWRVERLSDGTRQGAAGEGSCRSDAGRAGSREHAASGAEQFVPADGARWTGVADRLCEYCQFDAGAWDRTAGRNFDSHGARRCEGSHRNADVDRGCGAGLSGW